MELAPTGAISEPYMQLLPCLLAPVLWERPANISPLVRLLCAYLKQAAPQVVAQDKLVSLLLKIFLLSYSFYMNFYQIQKLDLYNQLYCQKFVANSKNSFMTKY